MATKHSVDVGADDKRNHDEYDYVRFTWSDLNGVARCRIVPGSHVASAAAKGVGVYAGILAMGPNSQPVALPEVEAIKHGNAIARPDTDTLHPVTWAGSPVDEVGEYFCDIFWQNGRPQPASPRYAARKQCERLHGRGLRLLAAFEMEFTLLDGTSGNPAWSEHAIFSNVVTSRYEPLFYEIEKAVRAADVKVVGIQTEFARGQCELSLAPKLGLQSADDFFFTKHTVKELAQRHGLSATFMAKPLVGEAGNGSHFNHSLWDLTEDDNVFYDPKAPDRLSTLAHHWAAGLVHHARALTALCCPTLNCYRRLHAIWAPTDRRWGIDDRRATFRVKNNSPQDTYMENRLPSGSANPYLVLAATVAAGLDGIDRELAGVGRPAAGRQDPLPYNLSEALTDLREDDVLCKALGEQLVNWFCQSKTDVDLKELPSTERPADNYTEDDAIRERHMYATFM